MRELLPQQHLARCAQSYEVKRRLTKIDTNRMNLHVDDPPPTCQHDPPCPQEDQAADQLINGNLGNLPLRPPGVHG
jgi:hypothetical protein